MEKKTCGSWRNNKLVNPITKRNIKETGFTYKTLNEMCNESREVRKCKEVKENINPITKKNINTNKSLKELLYKICNIKETQESKRNATRNVLFSEEAHNFTSGVTDCTVYPRVSLRDHQKQVCKFVRDNERLKGLLLFHSVGSGKTITAITLIRCILTKNKDKNVFVITPKSLVDNFKKEIKKLGLTLPKNVNIRTHTEFVNEIKREGAGFAKDSVIVIDEAHNFRTKINKENGKNVKELFKATKKASRVFLLSATPVMNNIEDFCNLYAMISNNESNIKDVYKNFKNYTNDELKVLLKNKISYFKNSDTSDYPSVTYKNIYLKMTAAYFNAYMEIENAQRGVGVDFFSESKNLAAFLNGVRRGVNYIESRITTPKIEWTINHIKKNIKKNKKTLIFSNWIGHGSKIIEDRLEAMNIKWVSVTGKITKKERDNAVRDYNSGKSLVMLISSAGSEGLDLKGTSSVIVLEQQWNNEKIKQVVGRAVRYKSHESMPVNQRHVDVYSLLLEKPNIMRGSDSSGMKMSADMILNKISGDKEAKINDFYKILVDICIENN